ncbi:ABC transporter ATP-binding protein [Paenibacillus sp. JMULE4]|nr:ABC transporter ATP-binding protein [Paenibacillus sp. JMULE4]
MVFVMPWILSALRLRAARNGAWCRPWNKYERRVLHGHFKHLGRSEKEPAFGRSKFICISDDWGRHGEGGGSRFIYDRPGRNYGCCRRIRFGKDDDDFFHNEYDPFSLAAKIGRQCHVPGGKTVYVIRKKMREIRGNGMAMVFQNAMTALDPSYTIGSQLMELLREKKGLSSQAAKKRSLELLSQVGMPAPEKMFSSYAHRLSGGLRQRAVIAMALSCEPSLIIADEPTTALDPTVQLQIIELFEKINKETGTAILLITHDFGVVARLAQKVAVMYAGQIVEQGSLEELLQSPAHPYTRSLLACIPSTQWIFSGKEKQKLVQIEGAPPSLAHLPPGCHFADRCPEVEAICRKEKPEMVKISHTAEVRCWKRG